MTAISANGFRIKLMVMASTNGRMEIGMKVSGNSVCVTVRDQIVSQMVTFTSASTTTEELTAMDSTDGPMEIRTPASSLKE